MKDRSRLDRIPKEELTAYEKWELPLLDQQGNEVTREEERDVKPLTAGDIEAIRQAGWEDGHADGRAHGIKEGHVEGVALGRKEGLEAGQAEGHKKALETSRSEVNAKLARLESVMAELLDPIQRHEDELETALVNLTTVLARAVIFRELSVDSSHIEAIVRQAIASLPSTRENVKVRVNPKDSEWVREVADRFEAETSIIDDNTILPGGCKVETRHSLVDFTVEKRFQKAVQGMLDQQLSSDQPGDSVEIDAMMGDLTDFHREVLSEPGEAPDTASEPSPAPAPKPEPQPASASEQEPEPEQNSEHELNDKASGEEGDDEQSPG